MVQNSEIWGGWKKVELFDIPIFRGCDTLGVSGRASSLKVLFFKIFV